MLVSLPSNAIGAVAIGPSSIEEINDRDHSIVYTFDGDGNIIGRVEGGAIHSNRVLASNQNMVTASSRTVTTLSSEYRSDFPIGYEDIVQNAVNDPKSGAATIWFNSGSFDGEYSNKFVTISAENEATSGVVPGIVRAATHCGERSFAVVQEAFVDPPGTLPENRLYEAIWGQEPVVRGVWDYPADFRSASREAACTSDGQTVLALYASDESRTDERGGSALTLVRINVSDGSRSVTELEMPGVEEGVHRGTMTVVGDNLYWINSDGDVLTIPVEGSSKVTHLWRISDGELSTRESVSGTTVAVVNYAGRPMYTEYELMTGEQSRESIELPWLESIVGSETPSGKNTYSISDVSRLWP